MNEKWDHVISEVDNWIWLGAAVVIFVIAKYAEVPAMNALAGACLVKIKGGGKPSIEKEATKT